MYTKNLSASTLNILSCVLCAQAYDTLSQTTLRRKYDESIKPDLYRVLGVPRTANLRQIIVAYRKLARSNHPDKGIQRFMHLFESVLNFTE